MNIPSDARETSAGSDDPIDEIRRIFEIAIVFDADQREAWLIDNVPNPATRHVVRRLLAADGQPGLLDVSVMRLLDAICRVGDQASHVSARRTP